MTRRRGKFCRRKGPGPLEAGHSNAAGLSVDVDTWYSVPPSASPSCSPKTSSPAASSSTTRRPLIDRIGHRPVASARGGTTLYKFRARNLVTKQKIDLVCKGTDNFQDADFEKRAVTLMYADQEHVHLLDQQDYNQYAAAAGRRGRRDAVRHRGLEGMLALIYNERVRGPAASRGGGAEDHRVRPRREGQLGHVAHQAGEAGNGPGDPGARVSEAGRDDQGRHAHRGVSGGARRRLRIARLAADGLRIASADALGRRLLALAGSTFFAVGFAGVLAASPTASAALAFFLPFGAACRRRRSFRLVRSPFSRLLLAGFAFGFLGRDFFGLGGLPPSPCRRRKYCPSCRRISSSIRRERCSWDGCVSMVRWQSVSPRSMTAGYDQASYAAAVFYTGTGAAASASTPRRSRRCSS